MRHKLRGGYTTEDPRLDRLPPSDTRHLEKFPLRAVSVLGITPGSGAVLGINWYENFDKPVREMRGWWIGRGDLGRIRGGHAIYAPRTGIKDAGPWYRFYDQGHEGACVGFSESRMMSHLNRHKYAAHWLYAEAQLTDEFPGEDYDGTSVRAGLEVLRTEGHRRMWGVEERPVEQSQGIAAYRWALTWDEVRSGLGVPPSKDGVPLLNSWGDAYPRVVHLTDEAGERLLREGGEAAFVTDR